MPSQMPRYGNRLSVTTVIRLSEPTGRRRSKIQGYSKGSCGRHTVHRKNKFKPGAAAFGIFCGDLAAVRFNDGSHDGQPHSKSFRFCTEKRIEKPVLHFLGNADTIITHAGANRAVSI